MDYQKQANDFAIKHGVKLTILGSECKKHFSDDKTERYVFKLKLSRGKKSYTFDFGQSIASGSKEPTMYDVLSCLTKYDVGSFEDFCGEFGYDMYVEDGYGKLNSKTKKLYIAVCKEFKAVDRLFNDVIEELEEIN